MPSNDSAAPALTPELTADIRRTLEWGREIGARTMTMNLAEMDALLAALESKDAELARLREALVPFARAGAVVEFFAPEALPFDETGEIDFPKRGTVRGDEGPPSVSLMPYDFEKAVRAAQGEEQGR